MVLEGNFVNRYWY